MHTFVSVVSFPQYAVQYMPLAFSTFSFNRRFRGFGVRLSILMLGSMPLQAIGPEG